MKPLKLVFIINPVSGTGTAKPREQYIRNFFNSSGFDVRVLFTDAIGHAATLAKQAKTDGADSVIAVGGDGTVNEVAGVLNGSECAVGIIPSGSGNGLARHHGIPLDFRKALEVIKRYRIICHDASVINDRISFNVSGIGFDAHVAHLFGKNGKRGFSNYIRLVIGEFSNYREQEIRVTTSSETITQPVMLAAIATASQFGNNAVIAPGADTRDGISNLTLIRKMNGLLLPVFLYQVFSRNVKSSKYVRLLRDEKFSIDSAVPLPLHIDGEPAGFHQHFKVETLKGSLKIIVP